MGVTENCEKKTNERTQERKKKESKVPAMESGVEIIYRMYEWMDGWMSVKWEEESLMKALEQIKENKSWVGK